MFASLFRFASAAPGADTHPAFGFITALDEHVKWKLHFETALRGGGGGGYSELQVARGDNTKLAYWLRSPPRRKPTTRRCAICARPSSASTAPPRMR
jgi:hypothetical protein